MIRAMSGDQRATTASVQSCSSSSRRPHPDARFVTAEYRRARLSVVLALLLLAGTAAYLVVQQRQQTWQSAQESVLNLALGLETSMNGLVEQSAYSLRDIAADLSRRPGIPPEPEQAMAVLAVLSDAARFDSVSSYLGLRTADGRVLAVDQSGAPVVSPDVLLTIAPVLQPRGTGLGVAYLVRLRPQDEWYLPITLNFRRSSGEPEVAFALVSVRRLLASTDSLRLLRDSSVSLVTTDGRMLVYYSPGTGAFKALRLHISQQSLERIAVAACFSRSPRKALSWASRVPPCCRSMWARASPSDRSAVSGLERLPVPLPSS